MHRCEELWSSSKTMDKRHVINKEFDSTHLFHNELLHMELSNNDKFYILIDGFVKSYTIHDNGSIKIGAFLSKSSIFTSIKPISILNYP